MSKPLDTIRMHFFRRNVKFMFPFLLKPFLGSTHGHKIERKCCLQCDQMLKSKVAQKISNVTQKYYEGVFYRKSPKVTKHLGYFCNENMPKKYRKIAQYGHTG